MTAPVTSQTPAEAAPDGEAPRRLAAWWAHLLGEARDDANLQRAKVRMLAENVRFGLVVSILLSLVVTLALFDSVVPQPQLFAWLAAMALLAGARWLLARRSNTEDTLRDPRSWLRVKLGLSTLHGLLWGAAGLFLFGDLSAVQVAAILLAVACVTAGVAANGVHWPMVAVTVVPALAPIAAYYFTGFGSAHKAMGLIVVVYAVLLLHIAWHGGAAMRRSVALAHRNDELLESLKQTVEVAEERERRFRIIADYSYAWECWFDAELRLIWSSPSARRISGYSAEELLAEPRLMMSMVHPEDRERVRKAMQHARTVVSVGDLEFRIVHKDGSVRWLAAVSNPVYDRDGHPAGFRSSMRDISLQRKLEAELQELASTDALTGALNRRAFLDKASEEVYRAKRYDKPLAVAMFDLDRFKQVNDTYGHQAGDACITRLAAMIQARIRKSDLFARFGGEEFVLLLPETGLDAALGLCERLRREIEAETVEVDGARIGFTVSVGLADFQMDAGGLEALIARADAALYSAKRNGRNQVAYRPVDQEPLPDDPPCHSAGIDRPHHELVQSRSLERPMRRE